MPNIRLHLVSLRHATATFLVMGIMVLVLGTRDAMYAQQTGQGETVISGQEQQELRYEQGTVHHATQIAEDVDRAARELVIGFFLVIGGIFFHVLYLVRTNTLQKSMKKTSKQS